MLNAAQRIQASLSQGVAQGVDTALLAAQVVSVWRDIDTALSPIIGHRGVAALFGRSISLAQADFPWLAEVPKSAIQTIDFAAIQTTLSQQTSADVVAANGALLQRFVDLLTHLIGGSLTDRLLRPVLDIHSSGDAAQDSSHDHR